MGEPQRDCLLSMVEFRPCRAHGHPGVSQHGRTWRTDRGGYSGDHWRRLKRARALEAASGVTVTTEPTLFILTNSRHFGYWLVIWRLAQIID